MPLSLSDYLAWIRSQTMPGQPMPSAVADDPAFGTRSSVTADGGDSNTGTAALAGRGDTSLGGRLALNADLNVNQFSAAKATFGLMGMLAGPIGAIAAKAAPGLINMDNQAGIKGALAQAGLRVGIDPPEVIAEFLNQTMQQSPHGQPGFTEGGPHPAFGYAGFNAPSQNPAPYGARSDAPPEGDANAGVTGESGIGAAAAADAAAGGSGAASGGVTVHQGGLIPDNQQRPNLEEAATLQEGEYVIRRERSKQFRPLLEAINKGKPGDVKRALKAALTA